MKEDGLMENNMEEDLLFYQMGKEKKVYGKMVKELNGLTIKIEFF